MPRCLNRVRTSSAFIPRAPHILSTLPLIYTIRSLSLFYIEHKSTIKSQYHQSKHHQDASPQIRRKHRRQYVLTHSPPLPHIHLANHFLDLTDKVAQESSDSTASSHSLHNEDHSGATSGGGGKAHAQDHKATPGPAISQDIGEPADKEGTKKRAAELNKI